LWISKYWKYLVIGVAVVVIFCIIAYMKNQRDYSKAEVRHMQLKLDVYKKMAELHSLETQRELIRLKQNYTQAEIEEIDNRIFEVDRKIGSIYKDIANLSLDDKIEEYNDLGK
jgi:uncharacterized membrane-anchored protein YhcB (DUF1043 family)